MSILRRLRNRSLIGSAKRTRNSKREWTRQRSIWLETLEPRLPMVAELFFVHGTSLAGIDRETVNYNTPTFEVIEPDVTPG